MFFLTKPLISDAALRWWKPLHYSMLTNIQKTHHLPWYLVLVPGNLQLIDVELAFQTSDQRVGYDKAHYEPFDWVKRNQWVCALTL